MQNGTQDVDSPIKKVTKRSRQILDSDDDDEAPVIKEQVASQVLGDKEAPSKTAKVNGCLQFFWLLKLIMFLQKQKESSMEFHCVMRTKQTLSLKATWWYNCNNDSLPVLLALCKSDQNSVWPSI